MIGRWLRALRRRRGTGLIVVMILTAVMGAYVVINGVALRTLQKRLTLIERRHQQRWAKFQHARPATSTPDK